MTCEQDQYYIPSKNPTIFGTCMLTNGCCDRFHLGDCTHCNIPIIQAIRELRPG